MLASSYLVEEGETFQSLNENQAVWFHKLGTPQSDDVLIHATPDKPALNHTAQVTDDGRYLLVTSSEGTDARYALTLYDLGTPGTQPRQLVGDFAKNWAYVSNEGALFIRSEEHTSAHQTLMRISFSV